MSYGIPSRSTHRPTYIQYFVQIGKTFRGRTDGDLRLTLLRRRGEVDLKTAGVRTRTNAQLVAVSGRSEERRVCHVPRQNSTFGDQSFAAVVPRTWNELPFSLRDTGLSLTTFKRTFTVGYLFSVAF